MRERQVGKGVDRGEGQSIQGMWGKQGIMGEQGMKKGQGENCKTRPERETWDDGGINGQEKTWDRGKTRKKGTNRGNQGTRGKNCGKKN